MIFLPHGCVVSTVAADALVLKHQAISIHNADLTFIIFDQFHIKNIAHKVNSIRKWNHILKKKWPSHLRDKTVQMLINNNKYARIK